jgi:hypothetical protein
MHANSVDENVRRSAADDHNSSCLEASFVGMQDPVACDRGLVQYVYDAKRHAMQRINA